MLVQTSDALSGFFMHRVALAPLAVLLQLDTIRIVLLVLLGRVVTALALRARQSDLRTDVLRLLRHAGLSSASCRSVVVAGAGLEPATQRL